MSEKLIINLDREEQKPSRDWFGCSAIIFLTVIAIVLMNVG